MNNNTIITKEDKMTAKEIQDRIIYTESKKICFEFTHLRIFANDFGLNIYFCISEIFNQAKEVIATSHITRTLAVEECEKILKDISLPDLECYMKNIKYTKNDINNILTDVRNEKINEILFD